MYKYHGILFHNKLSEMIFTVEYAELPVKYTRFIHTVRMIYEKATNDRNGSASKYLLIRLPNEFDHRERAHTYVYFSFIHGYVRITCHYACNICIEWQKKERSQNIRKINQNVAQRK